MPDLLGSSDSLDFKNKNLKKYSIKSSNDLNSSRIKKKILLLFKNKIQFVQANPLLNNIR